MLALVLGFGPIVITSWVRTLHVFADTQLVREGIAEIDQVLDDYPHLKIAVGPGAASFAAQTLRVIPVFRGNPLPIASSAWMALEAAGVSHAIIRRKIRECRVDLWLLPSGAPFVEISHYNGRNIYSEEVLADLYAAYTKQSAGQVFDQWICKRHDGSR